MLINSTDREDKNDFATPDEVYLKCLVNWGFSFSTVDVCASKENTKSNFFITKEINALTRNWIIKKQKKTNKWFVAWCNPPHDQTKEFVEKAFNQWKRFDMNIIMLIPINCLTSKYAEKYIHGKADIKILIGRIRFIDPKTNQPSKYPSVNGYCTILFKSKRLKKEGLDSFNTI